MEHQVTNSSQFEHRHLPPLFQMEFAEFDFEKRIPLNQGRMECIFLCFDQLPSLVRSMSFHLALHTH